MAKRRKRLEKGIESIGKQIEIHEKKMRNALGEGDLDLGKYYEKEIAALKKVMERKEKMKGRGGR